MFEKIQKMWQDNPYTVVISVALFVRLLAAVFSKGFGMLDDHFVIIETAQGWVNGDNDWFRPEQHPHRNLIYPGLHYLWFYFSDKILGLRDPQFKMLILRLLHAVYSVLIVGLSYKITRRISSEENAKWVGLISALFWPLPFLSVRNMVEVVCIPPVLAGFYFLIRAGSENRPQKFVFWAGVMGALSMTIRFQTAFFIAGIGLWMLLQKKWKETVWYGIGFITTVLLTMGLVDYLAWGIPFYSLFNYVSYNLSHQYDYVTMPWYNYIMLIAGIFIPPVSLFFIAGYLKSWKKYALLFWPAFLFFFFHSYFANKQERFILPFIPFIIILGLIGWNEIRASSAFWKKHKKAVKIMWGWFWSVNTVLLVVLVFTYSKKNRVESLYYLSHKTDVAALIWESNQNNIVVPPKFYLNKPIPIFLLPKSKPLTKLRDQIENYRVNKGLKRFPDYIVFLGEADLQQRVNRIQDFFNKKLIFEKRIDPSLIDYIVHKLNPAHNVNQTTYIYRIQ